MQQSDFKEDTRYVVTLRDENGKYRPAKFYVLKLHDDGMIVRLTEQQGILRKIAYDDVIKIVSSKPASGAKRYYVPEVLLSEQHWKGRREIQHYGSSPAMGK